MKEFMQKIPLWFWLISALGLVLIIFSMFQNNSNISMLAMVIISIANAIRLWKNERGYGIIFLVIAAFALFVLIRAWLRV